MGNNKTDVQWSQAFQAEVVYADTVVALNNSLISGISLWQFADIKASDKYNEEQQGCNFDWIPNETLVSYVNISCHRPKLRIIKVVWIIGEDPRVRLVLCRNYSPTSGIKLKVF